MACLLLHTMRPSVIFAFFLCSQLATSLADGARQPVRSKGNMVVSAHPLASQAGLEILRQGGNAVDGAVAVGLALAVVYPSAGNLGGGGFLLAYTRDGKVTSFDFREMAPRAADEKMFLDGSGQYVKDSNHEGYRAIGVPGTVAGFDLALKRLGRKSWKEVTIPAIRLAEKGFRLSWALASEIETYTNDWRKYSSSAGVFLKPDGTAYQPGELWKQPDLAHTLKRIQQFGRAGFYQGETARLLVEDMAKHGGLITKEDLDSYQAKEREPVRGKFRGYDIYSMGPPSSGGITLIEMLNILEGFDLPPLGHNSAQYFHTLSEVMRRAFADRARYLGDPDFNPNMPVGKMLSKEYASRLRGTIKSDRASISKSDLFNDLYESGETTHYSVVDAEGNAVVVTYTLEYSYGSRIVASKLGFLYNNEMGDFNPQVGRTDTNGLIGTVPNLIAPGKRMLSSMTPTILGKNGKPYLLVGSPGGRTIINTVLQVILNTTVFEMNISRSITAGRIHHQWLPDEILLERYTGSTNTTSLLMNMGHKLKFTDIIGSAMGIIIDPNSGLRMGAADPRQAEGSVASD